MDFVKITDFQGYSINGIGEVRNDKTGKILKPCKLDGFYKIGLFNNNKKQTKIIHRLVAIHFIPNPDNKPIVTHIDKNKLNNSIDNLKWNTIEDHYLTKRKS